MAGPATSPKPRAKPHTAAYPKPGPTGGKLIREVIAFLKAQNIALPIDAHILLATSGGADSIALAHLMAKYGRRISKHGNLRILHVNHRWRGEASDADARFVKETAKALKIPSTTITLKPPTHDGRSWEDKAREQRKAIFAKQARKHKAVVFTAHQADDLAETVLWRILTGTSDTHGGGILAQHREEIRPFLRIRKSLLLRYLEEENQTWKEDETNHQGRFLRSKMRLELLPTIEKLFPKAVDHLIESALRKQKAAPSFDLNTTDPILFLRAAGMELRRPHWEAIRKKLSLSDWAGEIHLPGGWILSRKRPKKT